LYKTFFQSENQKMSKFSKASYKTYNFNRYEDNPWVQQYAPHIDQRAKKFRTENSLKGIYGPVYESTNDKFPAGSRERKVFYKPQPVRGSQAMKRLSKASNSNLSEKDYDTLRNLNDVEVRLYGGNNGQPYRATLKPTKAKTNIPNNLKALYTRSQNENMPWSGLDSLRMNLITNPETPAQRKKMADFLNYIASDYQGGGYANYEVMPKIKPGSTRNSQMTKSLSKKLKWDDIKDAFENSFSSTRLDNRPNMIVPEKRNNSVFQTMNLGLEASNSLYPSAQVIARVANIYGNMLPKGKIANALRGMNTSDIVENAIATNKSDRYHYYKDVESQNKFNQDFIDANQSSDMKRAYTLGRKVRQNQKNIGLAGIIALAASMGQPKDKKNNSISTPTPTKTRTRVPTFTYRSTRTPTRTSSPTPTITPNINVR